MYTLATLRVSELRPHPSNYQTHTQAQIEALAESLQKFGQVKPIVVWRMMVLAGHGLVDGAKFLGWEKLGAIVVPSEWDELKALAYLVADNELGRLAKVDKMQLQQLLEQQRDVGEKLTTLGSSDAMLTKLTQEVERSIDVEGKMGTTLERCSQCGQLYKPLKASTQ